jgi:hypothetical protein
MSISEIFIKSVLEIFYLCSAPAYLCSNILVKTPFSALGRHPYGSRACPALDAGNPSSNTGSLLSQGRRLDSRLRGSGVELEFFRILLKSRFFNLCDLCVICGD